MKTLCKHLFSGFQENKIIILETAVKLSFSTSGYSDGPFSDAHFGENTKDLSAHNGHKGAQMRNMSVKHSPLELMTSSVRQSDDALSCEQSVSLWWMLLLYAVLITSLLNW